MTARQRLIAGRVLGGLAIAFLALDAGLKLAVPQAMIDHSPPLGLPADPGFYRLLGTILLGALALHLWPRTALLGAILVTAFLGGAVAVNLRAGMPLFGNTLFGVYVGVAFWAGFALRDRRVHALLTGRLGDSA